MLASSISGDEKEVTSFIAHEKSTRNITIYTDFNGQ